ncbi:MAG: SUMF1/EgtB/PvdO family nonheme iron enzyme, partial [Kiritimatiellae bacterium]|nr:SUMF1/EgtB/PvdO family nonheme iron enzyme [Kiritimatiellia bacterium]
QDSAGKEIGVITNDLKVSQGSTWVAQWQPPFNVRYENCTMTPYVYKGGQDDYMIVDLETWAVTFEGMATQDASNKKYNTNNDYKTKKLVLRKVPAGKYTITENGNGNYYDGSAMFPNHVHESTFDKDFYVGIFEFTEAQWAYALGDGAFSKTSLLPRSNVSWNTVRGSAGSGAQPSSGLIWQLNAKTGRKGFDLPTAPMWEVAARAGVSTKFLSGDTAANLAAYAWYDGTTNRKNVGQKLPNNWGLYDVSGNCWELTRDSVYEGDYTNQESNGLLPRTTGRATSEVTVGIGVNGGSTADRVTAGLSMRHANGKGQTYAQLGFRVAYIVE